MNSFNYPSLVSIHGGHSGEFCNHARDSLEHIVKEYVKKNFKWIGITEHMPPINNKFLYQDEREKGIDAYTINRKFEKYFTICRKLQKKYFHVIKIFIGFETETYSGYKSFVQKLIRQYKPDYIVGSVHHVNDIPIDYSSEMYAEAIDAAGGIDALYCRYFDLQYEMINEIKPHVVGHFDLIRIFDSHYLSRLKKPEIMKRICRNLECIRTYGLILDFNLRALYKGDTEPYISTDILSEALALNISIVPGDDSHGIDTVGLNIEKGINILQQLGFDTSWKCLKDIAPATKVS
ncbi:MAG: histidinol-phosphatase [Desulfobacteraceae bacterium]|nr:histidinol-phosphatase [Desulfobacteraceae bacterium]